MKTKHKVLRISLTSGLAVALTFGLWTPSAARADVELKGYERSLQMQGIRTRAQAEALKPGDTIAMVCAKCKTVAIQSVTIEKGHIKHVTPGEKHLCTGCNSYIKVVGVGKESKNELRHVCDKCGDNSAFCCATKPGETATEGMEKK
jgi:hypothetical protein